MTQKSCYMLVTPPPEGQNLIYSGRYGGFWVKFGDGRVREAYSVHNPSYAEAQNDHAGTQKVQTIDRRGKKATVKVGGQRMIPGDKLIFEGSSDSEWHFVSPKAPFTYAQLRKELKWLQGHFAALNLDERAPATAPGHAEARAWDARATALFCRNCDIIC